MADQEAHVSPKKGPTLSTSTSSFEALDPHDPNLSQLATTMFKKTEDYLYGEFTSTQDHYKRLEEMNHLTLLKCSGYRQVAEDLTTKIAAFDNMYSSLATQIQKVDDIERCVLHMEKVARALDSYSKRLESKYKQLKKTQNTN